MRGTRIRAVIGCAAALVVAAGLLPGSVALASPPPGAAPAEAEAAVRSAGGAGTTSVDDAARALDAMGGSGSAGIDPAQAAAQTRRQQRDLTGDIVFSVPGGTFTGQLSVALSTPIAGAEIRYTTDGTRPVATSEVYRGPLTFAATTQLRAQAFVAGTASGATGTAVYVARSFDTTGDLPLLVLDAYGGGKPGRDYRDAAAVLVEPKHRVASLSQRPAFATRAGFHLRGQSSSAFEKAPYRLEFRNNDDKDADYPVLGMPADADWALRGPFPDKTLVRDAFAYGLGRDMGLKVPRFAFVEVYLNLDGGPLVAADYQGVYLLVETVEVSPTRLNLHQLTASDVTEPAVSGGYVLQLNLLASEPPTLTCTSTTAPGDCWTDLELDAPARPQPEQQAWITNYVQKFHDSLRSENPSDPRTGYPAYIDVDSFVNRIIHNELSREGDAYLRSTHFFKDRGGKLVAGPLWDYDLGYAAFTGFPGFDLPPMVTGWQFEPFPGLKPAADWFLKLMQDPAFQARVQARWHQLRRTVMSDAALQARVTALSLPLARAAERNFQRWPILGTQYVGGFGTQVTQTWQEQVAILRQFLVDRAAWLDGSGWKPTPPGATPSPTPSPWPTVMPPPPVTPSPSVTSSATPSAGPTPTGV